MPVYWGPHNNSDIFIGLTIVDASALAPSISPSPVIGALPGGSSTIFRALVDTGAQKTMISTNVVNTLNLLPVGKILISGVGPSAHYHNGYLFHVGFIGGVFPPGIANSTPMPSHVQAIVNIHRNPIYGAEISLDATGGMFDVLLGMDVISDGLLVVGKNLFSWSY